jgi:hypothetical protein
MNNQELLNFVEGELRELETRDVDQLFECLWETCMELGLYVDDDKLYAEVDRQVEAEKRADKHAMGQ